GADREEAGGGARPPPKPGRPGGRGEERPLGAALGPAAGGRGRAGEPVDARLVPGHERLEGALVPRRGVSHEPLVFVFRGGGRHPARVSGSGWPPSPSPRAEGSRARARRARSGAGRPPGPRPRPPSRNPPPPRAPPHPPPPP